MKNQMHTIDIHNFPHTTKNSNLKKSLLLPKIIFSPRQYNEAAQILRTSPDASTKREAIQKLYPFEMTKPKASSQDKNGKRTIFSQVSKPKKPAFFTKKAQDSDSNHYPQKHRNNSKTIGIEDSITQSLSSEFIEQSKYDLKVEDEPLSTEDRNLTVKGINTNTSSTTPTQKSKANFIFEEKKKSKESLPENIFERVLAQKNKPPQEDFNDVRLLSSNSFNNSGIQVLPYTSREPNMNQFQTRTLPSKPNKLIINNFEDRPDIDKLPPFEDNAHTFAKYSHLLNLSNPQQVAKILVDRARTMKAASLARTTLDPPPLYSSPSNFNIIDRQSIQKSLQRNQIKNYINHQTYDRRTSENEVSKVVFKLDSHKIVLPSSRGRPQALSEPKILPPIQVPSLTAIEAAEENLLISFKYVPVVKYATKNKFTSITKRNGISPRRRLQLELDRKEFLMQQLETTVKAKSKSKSPGRDMIKEATVTLNSIEDTEEDEEESPQMPTFNQEEMYKRALAMAENDKSHYIDKIAEDIVMSAKYKL